jgi:uncharacterized protein
VRLAVLSDTHGPRFWKACPPAVAEHLRTVDGILHAGDVCTAAVLDELHAFAPVYVVLGNNDGADVAEWGAPEVLEVTLAGVAFTVVHDSGPAAGRLRRLRKRFPAAQCVVFGHSHIPWKETSEDGQFHIFNPGSPTDKRRQPHKTMGLIELSQGVIESMTIEIVD